MLRKLLILFLLLVLCTATTLAAKIITLPKPTKSGMVSLEESIDKRRSEREYRTNDLSQDQLSQVLWAAQGITDSSFGFRTAPSAGALYPLKIYVIKKDGVFRYLPDGHRLLQLSEEDKRPSLLRASLGQGFIREAPVSIVLSANFSITQATYGARAFRYVCMETGHVAENIHLQAVALGLASIPVGAFWDDVIKKVLELPDDEDPLYIIPVGYTK
ncbi:hypothetical protein A2291_05445 [candidate division WOR-1 bacterium RIFOXYB2_FULL_42_35]|uniref:Nitroreductase domain-containing protein n=1 Tax=candidate division WOR-1 bacterium RIFOXYC2_FULL_41_25 TaxID=1802586 RepID=A0A1F4TNQ8_UNCSA|nr:MAG: hypothetical protein A2247_00215 [candidate division WOR-1 bacterium RIFOXYA2_FULL_41_14]OGC24785.1 MAG: hypothetical protein A2291_05445 [candidate division WOR-1 bacterium RIFOXYB2_FULL_42_35]OGC34344.1 MAG: hypothetical protein A2462_07775 [candidate division WOR-1 bacterium RIFOXYC2_FULL_41_25]OGC42710.1 MAG: hypothetical protein A2548_07820 [candidate division WOR-1 bacterium RIFOXYD2_FULL_41_8]